MASTLTKRELSADFLFGSAEARTGEFVSGTSRQVHLPGESSDHGLASLPEFPTAETVAYLSSKLKADQPVVSIPAPARSTRRAPVMVRVNRVLQTALIGACALVVLGYGLDVAVSNEVTRQQEQTRRLSEENSELSAKLLKMVAYYSLQQSGPARFGLRSPEHVLIVKEANPVKAKAFKPSKSYLPLMSGY